MLDFAQDTLHLWISFQSFLAEYTPHFLIVYGCLGIVYWCLTPLFPQLRRPAKVWRDLRHRVGVRPKLIHRTPEKKG